MIKPIKMDTKEAMSAMATALDRILNGEMDSTGQLSEERQNGFVLLVFPFGDKGGGHCHYISNGADRKDIVRLFQDQIKRIEELDKGNGQ